MLALLDETIPDAKTSSLCNPRNVKLIGTVQHLTSRPKKITLKLALNSLIYRGIKNEVISENMKKLLSKL